ncbi:hypothetical protein QE416_000321 [Microbacterium sp. SORGH_AS 421]|nr:hypothetical protein [Microbacterium sp. SORGH_AS_0421]
MTAAAESIRALFDEIDRTPWGPPGASPRRRGGGPRAGQR